MGVSYVFHRVLMFNMFYILHFKSNIHYCLQVWGHTDNFVFSMKTPTFIYQINCKMNRKYSQDIDMVRKNYSSLKY